MEEALIRVKRPPKMDTCISLESFEINNEFFVFWTRCERFAPEIVKEYSIKRSDSLLREKGRRM